MKPDEAFSDLLGRVYECALDTSQWAGTLEEITHALGGMMAGRRRRCPAASAQQQSSAIAMPKNVAAGILEIIRTKQVTT